MLLMKPALLEFPKRAVVTRRWSEGDEEEWRVYVQRDEEMDVKPSNSFILNHICLM